MLTHEKLLVIQTTIETITGERVNDFGVSIAEKVLLKLQEIENAEKPKQRVTTGFLDFPEDPERTLRERFEKSEYYIEKYMSMSRRLRPRVEEYFIKRMRDDIALKTKNYYWLDEDFAFDGIANLVRTLEGKLIPEHFASYFKKFLQGQDRLFFDIFEPFLILPETGTVLYYSVNEKYISFHENRKFEGCGIEQIDNAIKQKINFMSYAF